MSRTSTHLFFASWLVLALLSPQAKVLAAGLEQTRKGDGAAQTDPYGDPLPEGAVARLGTLRFRPGQSRVAVALSPNGKTVATGEEGMVRLWDLATGKETWAIALPHAVSVLTIVFAPDGNRFAALVDRLGWVNRPPWEERTLYVVEVDQHRVLYELQKEHGAFDSVEFCAGGKILAACRGNISWQHDENPVVLWDAATGRELRQFPRVLSLAVSPDGHCLAGGEKDGTVHIWDVDSGDEQVCCRGHGIPVLSLAFSPDSKTLASSGGNLPRFRFEKETLPDDTNVRLWEVSTGKERLQCQGQKPIHDRLVFSPDGRTLAAEAGEDLLLWDALTGRQLQRFPGSKNVRRAFAFAPDSKTLLWSENGGPVHEWDLTSGKETRQWAGEPLNISQLLFSADGKFLVSQGNGLGVWDVGTRTPRHSFTGHHTAVRTLEFSQDGECLASLEENRQFRVWETRTGKLLLPPLPDPVLLCGFSPDGRSLAAVGRDGTVHVWELATGKELRQFRVGRAGQLSPEGLPGQCVLFAPGNRIVAVVGEDHAIHLWDLASGKEVHCLRGHTEGVRSLAFAVGGQVLVSEGEDSTIRLWDTVTGTERQRFTGQEKARGLFTVSPQGSLLAWSWGETIHLCDPTTGKQLRHLPGQGGMAQSLAFSRSGRSLASADTDGRVRLWDTATGIEQPVCQDPEDGANHIDFLPTPGDRLLAAGPVDKFHWCYRLRDLSTGREIHTWNGAECFTLSPDGRTLATAACTLVLRETATGGVVGRSLAGHRGPVTALAFSPDGRWLASGSEDSTILLWDWKAAADLTPEQSLAAVPRKLEQLWDDLASPDAGSAYRAVGALTGAKGEGVAWLKERLRPASARDGDRCRQFLADLDNEEFAVREKAARELEEAGAEVEPFLRQALQGSPSAEVRRRLETLLLDPGLRRWSPETLRKIRATQVLEYIGTFEARQVLKALAGGTSPALLTEEARAALDRLGEPAMPAR